MSHPEEEVGAARKSTTMVAADRIGGVPSRRREVPRCPPSRRCRGSHHDAIGAALSHVDLEKPPQKNKKSEILAESSVFQEFAQSLPSAGVALSGAPPSERSTQNRARLSATSSQTQKKRNSGVELQDDDYMSEGTGTAVSQASAPSPNTGRWPLQAASVASVGRLLTVLQCP